jgi:predicted  nucleic acid-binding Zn-ribbon protein
MVREQLKLLIKLQQIDLERERASAEREDNPRQIAQLEEELATAAAQVEGAKARVEALRKERRELEREVEESEEKLKKGQHRLLEVKTNQEYKAMLKELDHTRQANRKSEDRVLELMEEITAAEAAAVAAKAAFVEREKETAAQIEELKVAQARFEEEGARLEERRSDVLVPLSPELLAKYDFIRSRRNGQAVVPVRDAVCQACYMDIPPQRFIELQRSEVLMTCPSCNRIMYWGDSVEFVAVLTEAV